jgi:hypothetical protein
MATTIYRGGPVSDVDVKRAMKDFDDKPDHGDYYTRATFPDKHWKRYAVSHSGKSYPPKEILRIATGRYGHSVLGGGPEINRVYKQLGFPVVG